MGMVIRGWLELAQALEPYRSSGKRIISTNGVFDVLHVGHLRYLQAARALGDCLVVGVNSDVCTKRLKGATRPFVPEEERMEMLAGLQCVDFVTLFDDNTPTQLLEHIRPAIHAKGGDYDLSKMPEAATVFKYGGEIRCLNFEAGHSTTDLAEKIAATLNSREQYVSP